MANANTILSPNSHRQDVRTKPCFAKHYVFFVVKRYRFGNNVHKIIFGDEPLTASIVKYDKRKGNKRVKVPVLIL
jgi:hypothetical protein